MKLLDIFEEGKWGIPIVSTRTFKTTDGKKLKLDLYIVQKHGVPEAIGLELSDSTEVLCNYETTENFKDPFPDDFFYGTVTENNKDAMRRRFNQRIVPLFLNKTTEEAQLAFNNAAGQLHVKDSI